MENNKIPFEPSIDVVKNIKVVSYSYTINNILLFKSADINICLYDEQDLVYTHIGYRVEGEEYAGWANDDNYILELIKLKIASIE